MTKKNKLINRIYYNIKPAIPRSLQITVRRLFVSMLARKYSDIWPINASAGLMPGGWKGWPGNKKFAFVLTHDVETVKGEDRCFELMKLNMDLRFRAAFFFVPRRVRKSAVIMPELKNNGFEIGVHDLSHDGKLFNSRDIFQERALFINQFLSKWDACGFRAGSMHHNLDWIHDLNVLYDASTFDTDPFEPQPDGITTIFPSIVNSPISGKSFVELPYTLPQDFTLFVLLRKKNINIWKNKLDWIADKGGMALVITHPDYMNFGHKRLAVDEYRADVYAELLAYVKLKYEGQFWNALPSEIARYWISNHSVPRAKIKETVS